MTAAHDLHWDEPDAGCVHCGQPYATIADHRCGSCLGLDLVHCPHCLGRIAEIVERDVVRRWRGASHDVNDEWVATKALGRITERVAAVAARSPEAVALAAVKLREQMREASL